MMRNIRSLFHLVTIILSVTLLTGILKAATSPDSQAKVRLQQPAIYFTENRGQWDERVLYKADGGAGLTWWFERDGLTLAVVVPDTTDASWRADFQSALDKRDAYPTRERTESPPSTPRKGHALKLRFVPSPDQSRDDLVIASGVAAKQSQPATEVIPDGKLSWNNNYFLGNDSSKWAPDCGNFTRLTYRNVWDGIDVVYYGEGNQLKYDYVIKPGADPSNVRLRWLGLEEPLSVQQASLPVSKSSGDGSLALSGGMESTTAGDGSPALSGGMESTTARDGGATTSELLLATSVGTLCEGIPLAYQRGEDGARLPVEVSMRVLSVNEFGLEVTGDWDRSKELVVDPLVWSTFLGRREYDEAWVLMPDGEGGVMVAGNTSSNDFPTTEGVLDRSYNGGRDAFVTRLSENGSDLLYSTFLGGSGEDFAWGLTADGGGGVIVAGPTGSNDFPTTDGAYDRSPNGNIDAFVVRLSPDGSELIYSTYFGGGHEDEARAIALDGAGGVVVAGETGSNDFPVTEGAFDTGYSGGYDAFVALLSANGSELLYCTYLGGSGLEYAHALAPDGEEGAVVAGMTRSDDFPVTEGAFDRSFSGAGDAFIAKLNQNGNELIYCTYLGEGCGARALVPDGEGGVVVAGTTNGGFPTTEDAFDERFNGGQDAFIARLNEDGSELLYGTYFGGQRDEFVFDLLSDGTGGILAVGYTTSDDVPTTGDAFDRSFNVATDAFIARLSEDGRELLYGTYIGGTHHDYAYAIAPGVAGGVIVAGATYSDDFPTTERAFDRSHSEGLDVFVTMIDLDLPFLTWVERPDSMRADEGDFVEFSIHGDSPDENAELTLTYESVNIPDSAQFTDNGDGTGTFNWQTTFHDAGEYLATFTLSDSVNEIDAEVIIIVSNVNHAPVWTELPGDVGIDEGDALAFSVIASDQELDSLTLTAFSENLPEGWQFIDNDDGSGWFYWQTGFEDAGDYLISFTASDDSIQTVANVSISVLDVNSIFTPHSEIPDHYSLSSPFPNPFNSSTTIRFGLPVAGEASLRVTDTNGRLMATLVEKRLEAGWREVVWDAIAFPAGIYLVELNAGEQKLLQKVVLTR